MAKPCESEYLDLVIQAIQVCAEYRPKFGHHGRAGLTWEEFRAVYGSDAFCSWFGLDHPLMYAAHRAAGGMTSLYRQIGIGCQRLFSRIVRDALDIDAEDAQWSYRVPLHGGRTRRLSLDARIPLRKLRRGPRADAARSWLAECARRLGLAGQAARTLQGAVFEVRQGYKSKDAKRQNADLANAANAYANRYLPVMALLSTQIDADVADRYRRARWLMLTGGLAGSACDSTYVFMRQVIGFDLGAFFERNAPMLRATIEEVLGRLLRET